MTDKEKYDFIDHVVHLTLVEEDRLLNEHGDDYSGLEEDGIDSNEYYRIITERVITTLKENNNYMQEEPVGDAQPSVIFYGLTGSVGNTKEELVSKELEDACEQLAENARKHKAETTSPFFSPTDYKQGVIDGAKWKEQKMMAKAIDGKVIANGMGNPILHLWDKGKHLIDKKVKVIVIKED